MDSSLNSAWEGNGFQRYRIKEIIHVFDLSPDRREDLHNAITRLLDILKQAAKFEQLKGYLLDRKELLCRVPALRNDNYRPMSELLEMFRRSPPPPTVSLSVRAFVIGTLRRKEWDGVQYNCESYQKGLFWSWAEKNLNDARPLPQEWLLKLRYETAKPKYLKSPDITRLHDGQYPAR